MSEDSVPGCYGCVHWVRLGQFYVCDYAGHTGKLRSLTCRPGKYCTLKESRKKRARQEGQKSGRCKIDWDRVLQLYMSGLNDQEIANEVCSSRNMICAWRKKRNLKSNFDPKKTAEKQKQNRTGK